MQKASHDSKLTRRLYYCNDPTAKYLIHYICLYINTRRNIWGCHQHLSALMSPQILNGCAGQCFSGVLCGNNKPMYPNTHFKLHENFPEHPNVNKNFQNLKVQVFMRIQPVLNSFSCTKFLQQKLFAVYVQCSCCLQSPLTLDKWQAKLLLYLLFTKLQGVISHCITQDKVMFTSIDNILSLNTYLCSDQITKQNGHSHSYHTQLG